MSSVLQAPSREHILGTDKIGRDIFSRVLYGGRISILVGLGSALGAAFIGVLLGAYAGYKGGKIDKLILRISEIFMSFPQIVLVLLLVTILGQSLTNLLTHLHPYRMGKSVYPYDQSKNALHQRRRIRAGVKGFRTQ